MWALTTRQAVHLVSLFARERDSSERLRSRLLEDIDPNFKLKCRRRNTKPPRANAAEQFARRALALPLCPTSDNTCKNSLPSKASPSLRSTISSRARALFL